ncbi:MAG: GNAT family N-acetyltransferase [Marinicaulis sp.]|nr:GNAT family N-acetyltransferase [Marinicaulis sp.]NNE41537.1 GNAT family N-acetyltransferase [Marinicaulis sp.]NNL87873.1 GNAT family N-acetyltransferase [Marinicaulis sp.]
MNLNIEIPVLDSERLILREHRYADFPAMCEMWADPEVTKYIDGKPRPVEDCWLKFLRATGFWAHLGYGYWIVENKETGEVAGEVGIGDFKRMLDPITPMPHEFGWAFRSSFHGQGVATEAVKTAMNWADKSLEGAELTCIIDPANAPSIRVAEKCGLREAARAKYHGGEVMVCRREQKRGD